MTIQPSLCVMSERIVARIAGGSGSRRGSGRGRARSGTSGELLRLAGRAGSRCAVSPASVELHREAATGSGAAAGCSASAQSATKRRPMYFRPGDRVAVRDDDVRVDAHHAAGASRARSRPGTPQFDSQHQPPALDRHARSTRPAAGGAGRQSADLLKPVPQTTPVTSSQPGSVAVRARDVDAQAGGPGLDLVDLADDLVEAALRRSPAAIFASQPRRDGDGALEDLAEELDALVEVELLERVDAERLEEAARRVQVLLVGRRVAEQRDHLARRRRARSPTR